MAFTLEELIGLTRSEYANIVESRKAKVSGWFMRMDGEVKKTFEGVLEESLEEEARKVVTHAIDHVNPNAILHLDVLELAASCWNACDDQVKEEYDHIDIFYGFSQILEEWGYDAPTEGKIALEIKLDEVSAESPEEAAEVDESAA
jgi:hypothetical protein